MSDWITICIKIINKDIFFEATVLPLWLWFKIQSENLPTSLKILIVKLNGQD